jgi:hypothetical protein
LTNIMSQAQKEEFIYFGIDLDLLLKRTPVWRNILRKILFKNGDLIQLAEKTEEIMHED